MVYFAIPPDSRILAWITLWQNAQANIYRTCYVRIDGQRGILRKSTLSLHGSTSPSAQCFESVSSPSLLGFSFGRPVQASIDPQEDYIA